MNQSDTRDVLSRLFSAPLGLIGLDLEAVELTQAGKRRVLRVAVDKDGGVTMDDVAEATRVISDLLDDDDAMGQSAYTLEVSSPGIGRPLTLPRHWRRNQGKLVKVVLLDGDPVEGRIRESDEESVVVDTKAGPQKLAYAQIKRAKVQVEFKRAEGEDV